MPRPSQEEILIAGTVVCMRNRSPLLPAFYGLLVFCAIGPSLLCAQDYQAEFEHGKAALEAGRLDEAESILSQLVSVDPQAQHYYYRGLAMEPKARTAKLLTTLAGPLLSIHVRRFTISGAELFCRAMECMKRPSQISPRPRNSIPARPKPWGTAPGALHDESK